MIELNRHRAGRLWNTLFGAAQVLDGLVRIVSFGWLHTRLPLEVSKTMTKSLIRKETQ